MRFRGLVLSLCVWIAATTAGAVEAPPGSKNFTPPGSVPNYFSNEAGAVRGGPAPAPLAGRPAYPVAAPRSRLAVVSHRYAGRNTVHGRGRYRVVRGRGYERRGHVVASRGGRGGGSRAIHASFRHSGGRVAAARSGRRLARAR